MDITMDERVIRMDERIGSMMEKIDSLIGHAENGGWGRCRERGEIIADLREDVADMKKENTKFKWMVFSGVFTVILGLIFL